MPADDPIPSPELTVTLRQYGCVLCQRCHREGADPLFGPHLYRQSKHGWWETNVYQAILEAAAAAGMAFRKEGR